MALYSYVAHQQVEFAHRWFHPVRPFKKNKTMESPYDHTNMPTVLVTSGLLPSQYGQYFRRIDHEAYPEFDRILASPSPINGEYLSDGKKYRWHELLDESIAGVDEEDKADEAV